IELGGEALQTVFAEDLERRLKEAKWDLNDDDNDQLAKFCISAFRDSSMLPSFGTKVFRCPAVKQEWSIAEITTLYKRAWGGLIDWADQHLVDKDAFETDRITFDGGAMRSLLLKNEFESLRRRHRGRHRTLPSFHFDTSPK
ncbi:hypothetical protein IFR05_017573, partial [Cadophora sp. M221]